MTSQRVKEQKVRHDTKSSSVTVVLYTLWRLLWSITVKNKKYNMRWSRVVLLLFFTRSDVFCDLLQCTRKNVTYLFRTIKIQRHYWRVLGHERRKTNLLTWSDVDLTPSVCVSYRSRVIAKCPINYNWIHALNHLIKDSLLYLFRSTITFFSSFNKTVTACYISHQL